MKQFVLIATLIICNALQARATHLFGGELLYTHDSLNSYKLSLTVYGDCSGSAFPALAGSTPIIYIYDGARFIDSTVLYSEGGTGTEVSPVCPKDIGKTSCNGGVLPGVKRFVYSGHYIVKGTSANWRFVFTGSMGAAAAAGRSTAITNIRNPMGNTVMYLVATLNNINGGNNSPAYTTIPTPFYCINVAQQYNQGCTDMDGDSLAYELTPALDGGTSVIYVSPYTYKEPMAADTFSFDPISGQLVFTANALQDALIVTKVSEYKNGVLVGSSMREMTFVILDNCNVSPPKADMSNVVGGYNVGNTITVCQGTSDVSFTLSAYDSVADNVEAVPSALPSTATLNITNNNTTNPHLFFSWHTATVPTGIYNFFVTYKNDHCPISSSQTIAYTIIVVPPYQASTQIIYPTQCLHKAFAEIDITGGALPRIITLQQGGKTIKTYKDITGKIRDSLVAGSYTAIITSPNGSCPVTYDFIIPDNGTLPDPYPLPVAYCLHATASPLQVTVPDSTSVQWYDSEKKPIAGPPTPSTDVAGIYTWYVTALYKTCSILFSPITVPVYNLPQIDILNKKTTVCLGDKVYLEATGGTTYKWTSTSDEIIRDKDGRLFSLLMDTTTYKVVVTDEHNCTDSSQVSYYDIQPCCLFSYPNAFTPNGDGRNDRFRVLTYGNMESFELTIFNRWGQRVFVSADPFTGWDGFYHGQPCETGTYFYLLRAKCLTGHEEEYKGDLTLIR